MMEQAKAERRQGNAAAAEATYSKAAEQARSEGSDRLRAHALRHVAGLAAERGAGEHALEAAEEAVAIYRADAGESPLNLANARRVRALAFASLGRAAESSQDWQGARELYQQLGIAAGVAECDLRLSKP
jgi:tetratricopeptide (TPR) repeat protein